MMTNASTTLMWNFLYGFTIQRTARQSKMSRQWMNCQVARVRREVIEKSKFHCALSWQRTCEWPSHNHTTSPAPLYFLYTHIFTHACNSLTLTLNTLIPSHCHTCTSHPHTFSHSYNTLTVNHTRTLILSHMHPSHSHIQLILTLSSHHIPAQQILWWNQETHSQPQTAVVSRYPRHCTSGNAAYPSDHMSRHWMLVWLSVGN